MRSSEKSWVIKWAMGLAEQRQKEDGLTFLPPPAKIRRTPGKNMTLAEKIHRRKLYNREAASLSRKKMKSRMEILCGTLYDLTNNNSNLVEEIEVLRSNREQLMAENKSLHKKLSDNYSSIPEPVIAQSWKTDVNNKILIEEPAVSIKHPLKNDETESSILSNVISSNSVFSTDHPILPDIEPPKYDEMEWFDNDLSDCLEKIVNELLGKNSAEEYSLNEMIGSTSNIMEPDINFGLFNIDGKDRIDGIEDYSQFMLNIDTEFNNIYDENTLLSSSNVDSKCEAEKQFENKSYAQEEFTIVDVAEVEITTTSNDRVLEIFQEHNYSYTEHYKGIGYESY